MPGGCTKGDQRVCGGGNQGLQRARCSTHSGKGGLEAGHEDRQPQKPGGVPTQHHTPSST